MTVFTCQCCGSSIKKNQIEKHLNNPRCGRVFHFSCMDCGKDFKDKSYDKHVRCITEAEKYGGVNYQGKVEKGRLKQESWVENINEAMANTPNLPQEVRRVLSQICECPNIPRKKQKFVNFIKNNGTLRVKNPATLDTIWDLFSNAQPKPAANQAKAPNKEKEKDKDKNKENKTDDHKSKKRKCSENEDEENGDSLNNSDERKKRRKKKNKKGIEDLEEMNGTCDSGNSFDKSSKKKKKHCEDSEAMETVIHNGKLNDTLNSVTVSPFKWKEAIKKTLKDAPPEKGLKVNKLRKKVLAQYYASAEAEGNSYIPSAEELSATFEGKLKNNKKFIVLKDHVRLKNSRE